MTVYSSFGTGSDFSGTGAAALAFVEGHAENRYRKFGKRLFDLLLASCLLMILLPVIAALWLMVRRDGGPGFFGHRRVGQDGRAFRCYKIRTMVVDAEQRLSEHLATDLQAAAEWARDHKLENDPRITRLGAFLRKTSLDELPQIWNVLRGEMSLVGPRPIVRSEMHRYGHYRPIYKAMKPGVTGLWQVSGRNDVSYDERVSMDVSYFEATSLKTDLWILTRTATSVVARTGK